jgi:hypothetical protein
MNENRRALPDPTVKACGGNQNKWDFPRVQAGNISNFDLFFYHNVTLS